MTVLIRASLSAAPVSQGRARIPFMADCKGYHLLGSDLISSVRNLVDPTKPLVAIGTPAYPSPAYARCSQSAGFRTSDSFSSRNTTAMIWCTAAHKADKSGFTALAIKYMSFLGSALYEIWYSSTEEGFAGVHTTALQSANPDNEPGFSQTSMDSPELRCIRDNGANALLTVSEATICKEWSGAAGSTTVTAPIAFCGDGFSGDAVSEVYACAYFSRALSFAEVAAVNAHVLADIAARGAKIR